MKISDSGEINNAVKEYYDYIAGQVLADEITLEADIDGMEIDMDDFVLNISVDKV